MSKYFVVHHIDRKNLTRIFSKMKIPNGVSCWTWKASSARGYGKVSWKGKAVHTHRLMYSWAVGPIPHYIPGGMELDHLCKNKICCNPSHLELVTPKINIARSTGVCGLNANKTHCKRGHLLEGGNLIPQLASRRRECVTCHNARQRAYHAKKRLAAAGS